MRKTDFFSSAFTGWATRVDSYPKRFLADNSGSYAVIAAIILPVLIGVVGLGTDVGIWLLKHGSLQTAADSGALSAANALQSGESNSNATLAANAIAASYGFAAGSNGTVVTVNMPPTSGSYQNASNAIEVILQISQARNFSSIWNSQPVTIKARAVATQGSPGSGCVLALDPSASGAATTQGSATVSLNGCALYDNSQNSSALTNGGSATISALAVDVVGGISNTSGITTTKGIATGVAAASDPYASDVLPSFSGCDYNNLSIKTTKTLNPGVYCGGITVSAQANVTLNPGTYYMDQGSFSVAGGGTITGTGVTLVLTSSSGSNYATIAISGGAVVSLTAPSSGPLSGIAVFADRKMPLGTTLKFTGGTSENFGGDIYAPTAAVSYSGGSSTSSGCTKIIGDTVSFVGNSGLAINCTGYGTQSIGLTTSHLVE